MQRPKKLFLLCLALAISIFAQGVLASEELNYSGKLTDETRTREIKLPATEPANKASLKIKATIKSGQTSWTLRDPNGKVRLTGSISKGDLALDSGELDAIKGTWTLQIDLESATLSYELHWRTR
jgi:hypothetical protein